LSSSEREEEARQLATVCAREAYARRGEEIVVYDLRGVTDIADFFVIASGESRRQLQAIASGMQEAAGELDEKLLGLEGLDVGNWILLDFGDCVVHLFQKDVRRFYDLDMLWGDAPRVKWEENR